MKRVKVGILVVAAVLAIGAIALAFLLLPSFISDQSAVPFQSMEVSFEDSDGVATIRTETFQVAFEGQSFGNRRAGGTYVVDGRYGFRLFPGPESTSGEANGVVHSYSQRRRLATFRYQGHKITYSHATKTLTIDGQEHSTAEGPVRLLIKRNGAVERMDK
ncbi:MAG TPA: hypothetical protein VFE62_07625 [Gemmataceae bacterium]|nr:hypothetical protein [Gemmataceae bacterium]